MEPSDEPRLAKLREHLLSHHAALAELTHFTAEQAAAILARDRNVFGIYEKQGKVFPSRVGRAWRMPVHHLARYFCGVWADQWQQAADAPPNRKAVRCPAFGAISLGDLGDKHQIALPKLQMAVDGGYLPATVDGAETFVFWDDFLQFVKVNRGVWRKELRGKYPNGNTVLLGFAERSRYADLDSAPLEDLEEEEVGDVSDAKFHHYVERPVFPGEKEHPSSR